MRGEFRFSSIAPDGVGGLVFDYWTGVLAVLIAIPVATGREIGGIGIFLYRVQAFIASIVLLMVGFIFILQGWRLDPILQFGCFLFHLFLIYLGVKDIILFKIVSRRISDNSSDRS